MKVRYETSDGIEKVINDLEFYASEEPNSDARRKITRIIDSLSEIWGHMEPQEDN